MDSSGDLSALRQPGISAPIPTERTSGSFVPVAPPGIRPSSTPLRANPGIRQELTPAAQRKATEKSKSWLSQNWKKVAGWTFVGIGALSLVLGIATLPFFGGGTAGIVVGCVFLAAGAGLLAWDKAQERRSKISDALKPSAIQSQVRSEEIRRRANGVFGSAAKACSEVSNP